MTVTDQEQPFDTWEVEIIQNVGLQKAHDTAQERSAECGDRFRHVQNAVRYYLDRQSNSD